MFLFKKTCHHEKISAFIKSQYCPDCGEYVENHWFITRCPICGKKHKTVIKNGKPVPAEKFCQNCGSQDFKVEEIDSIDIVSINYAAYITKTVKKADNRLSIYIEKAGKINFLTIQPA